MTIQRLLPAYLSGGRVPTQTLLPAALGGPVWVIAPHPDDESLGCGGLIAELCGLGTVLWALLLTDGSASHPGSREWPARRLATRRLGEWHAGLDRLGVHPKRRLALGLSDGRLPWPRRAEDALTPEADEAARAIRAALAVAPPATVLLPWRRDPHPDHRAAHALVQAALVGQRGVRQLEYAVWLAERAAPEDLPQPGEVTGWEVRVERQLACKEAAIRAHRSQLGQLVCDDPDGFVLPQHMVRASLDGSEWLLEANS